jgi:hypothetical protein
MPAGQPAEPAILGGCGRMGRRWRLATAPVLLHKATLGRGCSSGVEHHVANVRVEGSNPFARSNLAEPGGTQTARNGVSSTTFVAGIGSRIHLGDAVAGYLVAEQRGDLPWGRRLYALHSTLALSLAVRQLFSTLATGLPRKRMRSVLLAPTSARVAPSGSRAASAASFSWMRSRGMAGRACQNSFPVQTSSTRRTIRP